MKRLHGWNRNSGFTKINVVSFGCMLALVSFLLGMAI